MSSVAVQTAPGAPSTSKKPNSTSSTFADTSIFDNLASDNDYATLKKLQRHLE